MDDHNRLLQIANVATTLGNHISTQMVTFLNTVKESPLGFRDLGLDFLAVCQILNSLLGSLTEQAKLQQPFPAKAIPELSKVLTQTLDDFGLLENLLHKFIEYEKGGTFAMLQKTWRMVFADKDIAKIRGHLQANKGALNMTMLLTSIKPAQSTVAPVSQEYSMLATKLEQPGSISRSIATVDTSTSSISSADDQITPSISEMSLEERAPENAAVPAVEQEKESSLEAVVNEEKATATHEAVPETESGEAKEQESTSRKMPLVTLVDRSKLGLPKRTPKKKMSNTPASLTKTLISAVQSRKVNIVEQLLDRGVSPDTTPENSLMEAIWRSDIPTLTLLLEFGADPNIPRQNDETPLRCACQHNREPEVKLLLEYGADPNLPSEGWTPLPWVFNHRTQESLVLLLLQYGADPNLVTRNGWTPLTFACDKNNSASIIQDVINYGADPNQKNGDENTPLQIACEHDQPETVSVLLSNGADPNLRGRDLPVLNARRSPACMSMLIAAGADVHAFPGLMEKAVWANSIETIEILLDAGADPNSRVEENWSAVTTAIRDNRIDILKLLLARGADPNSPGEGLPVLYAARYDDGEECTRLKMVLDAGANVNAQDERNGRQTALIQACDRNLMHNVTLLLERGADVDLADDWGKSAMDRAADKGHEELVIMMLDRME